ncbi:hypothetical protein CHARACLAT_018854 [Characodon lateralis]|uniref:Uncharacterized protein n=1 Tax=Characodon lateralis TaxID=208331 RepID=A0ABU7DAV8_9TELE|nr:hypothetical protein [Characodon lateralis]
MLRRLPSAPPLSARGRPCIHLLKDCTGNTRELSQGNTDLPKRTCKIVQISVPSEMNMLSPGHLFFIKLNDQTELQLVRESAIEELENNGLATAASNQSSEESSINEAKISIYPLR